MIELALTAKLYAYSLKGISGMAKRLQKFIKSSVNALATSKHEQYNYKKNCRWSNNFSTTIPIIGKFIVNICSGTSKLFQKSSNYCPSYSTLPIQCIQVTIQAGWGTFTTVQVFNLSCTRSLFRTYIHQSGHYISHQHSCWLESSLFHTVHFDLNELNH